MCRMQSGCANDSVVGLLLTGQRFGNRVPRNLVTKLNDEQTVRGTRNDRNMPRRRREIKFWPARGTRVFPATTAGGSPIIYPTASEVRVKAARIAIRQGRLETPMTFALVADDMTRALQAGAGTLRQCSNDGCMQVMVDRGGGNFYCPSCGNAQPSM